MQLYTPTDNEMAQFAAGFFTIVTGSVCPGRPEISQLNGDIGCYDNTGIATPLMLEAI